MKNRIYAIVLAIVTIAGACFIGACGGDKQEEEEILSERAQTFVDAVDGILTPITLESGDKIDSAYVAYGFLDEYDRESVTVTARKQTLDEYQSIYAELLASSDGNDPDGGKTDNQQALTEKFLAAVKALPAISRLTADDRAEVDSAFARYNRLNAESKQSEAVLSAYNALVKAEARVAELEEAAMQEEWLRMADEFIGAVADIGTVTLDSVIIADLLFEYDHFPEGLKKIGGMAEAKAVLDIKYGQYQSLKDEADVIEFAAAVEAIGGVTLASESAIRKAESIYKYMSDNAKSNDSVIEAYEILAAARAQYNELFAVVENERIQRFIAAAENIPTDLENVDISWYEALYAAQEAYFELTYESMSLPEVEAAFERWNEAQKVFDKKGYKQIPMVDPNLLFSGDTPPHIVLQLEDNMLDPVLSFYGVSTMAELAEEAVACLDIYVDGVYIAKGELDLTKVGHIIANTEIVAVLKSLSAEYPEISGGSNFSFSIHFEDKLQRYIPSEKTKVSESKNTYTW